MLPIGDQKQATERMRQMRQQQVESTSAFTYGNYYRFYPAMAGQKDQDWENTNATRLANRLKRHQNEIFTFVLETEVPFDNNFAERMIRLGVIMRKSSFNNRSQKGA